MDIIIDAFYFFDIIINFRTCYYNEDGEEETTGWKIALRYVT